MEDGTEIMQISLTDYERQQVCRTWRSLGGCSETHGVQETLGSEDEYNRTAATLLSEVLSKEPKTRQYVGEKKWCSLLWK